MEATIKLLEARVLRVVERLRELLDEKVRLEGELRELEKKQASRAAAIGGNVSSGPAFAREEMAAALREAIRELRGA